MIIFLHRWNFYRYFYLSSFSFPDFKPDFLEVFKTVITPYRKHIFVENIEFAVIAASDHSQHEWLIASIIGQALIFESYSYINFLDRSREQDTFPEGNIALADVHKVFGRV